MSIIGDQDFHFPSRQKWDYDKTYIMFVNPKKISEIPKDVRDGKKKNSDPIQKNKKNNSNSMNHGDWNAVNLYPPSPKEVQPKRGPVSFADPFSEVVPQHEWPDNEQPRVKNTQQRNQQQQPRYTDQNQSERPRHEAPRQQQQGHGDRPLDRGVPRQDRPERSQTEDRNIPRQDRSERPVALSEFSKMSPSDFRTRGLFANVGEMDFSAPPRNQPHQQQGVQKRPEQGQSQKPKYNNGRRELSADDQMILRQAKRDRSKGLDVPEYDGTNFEEVYAAVQMVRTDNYMFLFVEEKKNKIKAKVGTAVAIASALNAPVDGVLEDTQNVLAAHEQVFENQFYLAGMPQPSSSDLELWKAIGTASLIRVLDNYAEKHKRNRQTDVADGGGHSGTRSYAPMPEGGKGALGKILNVAQTFLGGGAPASNSNTTSASVDSTAKSPLYTTTTSIPAGDSKAHVAHTFTPTVHPATGSSAKKYDASWMNQFDIPWTKSQQPSPSVSVSVGTPVIVPPKPQTPVVTSSTVSAAPAVASVVPAPPVQKLPPPPTQPASEPLSDLDLLLPPPSVEQQVKLGNREDDVMSTSSHL